MVKQFARLAMVSALLSGLGSIGTVSAADDTMAGLYEAAKSDGRVVVFGPPNAQVRQEIVKAFTSAFPGVALDWTGAQGNEIFAKMQGEQSAGVSSIDVILSGATTGINVMKPAKLIQPLEPWLTLAEVKDPKNWLGGRLHWVEADRLTLAYVSFVLANVTVNEGQVPKGAIKSYKDLLDPKWKGKIVSNSPVIPGSANIFYRLLHDTYGEGFLEQLSRQDVVVMNDLRQAADLTAKGRYAIAMGLSPSIINYYLEQGVKTIRPLETAELAETPILTSGFGTIMVPVKPPHIAATKLFVNWFLSKEGQTAAAKGFGYGSRRLDVPVDAVPQYLRLPRDTKYYEGDTDEFLGHPNHAKMMEAARKYGLYQK